MNTIDRSIHELVRALNNLEKAEVIQGRLIGLGKKAVPAVADFLLEAPGNLKPRGLAAEALRIIGGQEAFDVLVKGLNMFLLVEDPVVALEEEAVKNRIASELKYFGERAVGPLLEALERQRLVGAAESLAELNEQRAIPFLIELLEDSFKRSRISEAILRFDPVALEKLIETTKFRKLEDGLETHQSMERRAAATRLIGIIGGDVAFSRLAELLYDYDEQKLIRCEAALHLIRVTSGHINEKAHAVIREAMADPELARRFKFEDIFNWETNKGGSSGANKDRQ